MVGLSAAFQTDAVSFNRVMVQLAGVAYRMPAAALRAAMPESPVLRHLLLRAYEVQFAAAAQTARLQLAPRAHQANSPVAADGA